MEDYRITLRQKGFVWNEAKRAYEKIAPVAAPGALPDDNRFEVGRIKAEAVDCEQGRERVEVEIDSLASA